MAPRTRPAGLLAAGLALAVAGGCGEDEKISGPLGPTGNPKLTIHEVNGAERKELMCVPVGPDPDATISVNVHPDQLLLRPPGTCGAYAQCGHMLLRINGVENNRGSAPVIDAQLQNLADRYAELTISIEVRTDSGELILNQDEVPLPVGDTVKVITVMNEASCPEGTGGSGGAGGSGSGGAGGSGSGGAGGSGSGGAGGSGSGGAGGSGSGGAGGSGSGGAGGSGSGGAGGA
jgi:hypothetical protein